MTNPTHSHNEEHDSDRNIPQNLTPPVTLASNFMGYAYNFVGDYPIYDLSYNYQPPFSGYYPLQGNAESQINPAVQIGYPPQYYIPADMHYNLNAQSLAGYSNAGYVAPPGGIYAGYPQFTPNAPGPEAMWGAFMSPYASNMPLHPYPSEPITAEKMFSKKTWQIIGGMSAAVIVLLAVIIIPNVMAKFSTNRDAEREQQAVKSYFLALSEGDANKALALSHNKPANLDFLSPDILEQQISQAPISDIRVEKPTDPNLDLVKYSISINGKVIQDELKVIKQADGSYQLDKGYITLSINNKDHRAGLTLFGKPVQDTDHIIVFPGTLDFGSLSDFVHFSIANPEWSADYNFTEVSPVHPADIRLNLQPELTPLGQVQVVKLIISNIIFCSRSDNTVQHCPTAFAQHGDTEKLRLNEPEYVVTDSGKTDLGIIPFQIDIAYTYSNKGMEHTSKVTLKGVVNSLAHGTSLSVAWDE